MADWYETDAEKFNNQSDWWAGNYYGNHQPIGKDWLGNSVHEDGSKSWWNPLTGKRHTQNHGGWWS